MQALSSSERDRYYAEGVPVAVLYGATGASTSEAELKNLFHATAGQMEHSDTPLCFVLRAANRVPSDDGRPNRMTINQLWDLEKVACSVTSPASFHQLDRRALPPASLSAPLRQRFAK